MHAVGFLCFGVCFVEAEMLEVRLVTGASSDARLYTHHHTADYY